MLMMSRQLCTYMTVHDAEYEDSAHLKYTDLHLIMTKQGRVSPNNKF